MHESSTVLKNTGPLFCTTYVRPFHGLHEASTLWDVVQVSYSYLTSNTPPPPTCPLALTNAAKSPFFRPSPAPTPSVFLWQLLPKPETDTGRASRQPGRLYQAIYLFIFRLISSHSVSVRGISLPLTLSRPCSICTVHAYTYICYIF